jgi:hypothetical protein
MFTIDRNESGTPAAGRPRIFKFLGQGHFVKKRAPVIENGLELHVELEGNLFQ